MSKEVKGAIVGALITGFFAVIAACITEGRIFPSSSTTSLTTPAATKVVSDAVENESVVVGDENAFVEETSAPVTDAPPKEINIRDLIPLVGRDEKFWVDAAGEKDNLGKDDYELLVYCGDESRRKDIIYPLDKKYKTLKGRIALSETDNDIDDGVWFEFYEGEKKIGKTKHLKAGERPFDFEISVKGVKDLRIVATGSFFFNDVSVLTNGFYLEE